MERICGMSRIEVDGEGGGGDGVGSGVEVVK